MATTIRSTDLDFDTIKNNLKVYLQQQPEFADYNFEASGLSNLLDVLAWNTHQNALTANFALNESFLTTAQLRSSLVGLASGLGYTVGSRSASFAVVQIYVQNTDADAPASYTMPAGFSFTTTVDSKSYTFKTRDTLIATDDGNGTYYFAKDGNINIPIYEGITRTKTFIVDNNSGNDSYIIPINNLDLDTVDVRVYDNNTTSQYDTYININNATSIDESSRIFVIKETPNGFYEVTFGNGVRLGQRPIAGNVIRVFYDTVSGVEANGARTFTTETRVSDRDVAISTISVSTGGSFKEDIESIRKNAPYLYATQNRMVTAEDYSALILRNFRGVITDIKAWGGEDNLPTPDYGTVFISIVFSTDDETIQDTTKSDITSLAKDLSVASFDVKFTDPTETYLELGVKFQFNPNLTSLSQSQIESTVSSVVTQYFNDNLGSFDQSFRRSNLLTEIDDADNSVLSSRADVKMQNRFVPTGLDTHTIQYPAPISVPEDDIHIIRSGNFLLNGSVCYLQNKLETNIIEVINVSSGAVFVDNIGTYDANSGTLILTGFTPVLISGSYIKITAIPANQSVINAVRQDILLYDATESTVTAVLTDTV